MKVHPCPGYLDDPPEIQKALDDGGYWLACEWPERPVDAFMVTIAGCNKVWGPFDNWGGRTLIASPEMLEERE